jgi:hypothetical protein
MPADDNIKIQFCLYPCPCGYWGDPAAPRNCTCSPAIVTRYQKRISGPLLDRCDTQSASTCRASTTKNSPPIAPANQARPFASACCPRARSSSLASTAAVLPATPTHLHLRCKCRCKCGPGAHSRILRVGRDEQSLDAQRHEPTGHERARVSSGTEVRTDDCGFSGGGKDSSRAPGRGDSPAVDQDSKGETQ